MCLLIYYPEHVKPDIDALFIGSENNPDGHGYAIVVPSENRIIVHRGLDPDRVITRFIKERELYPDGPALFHSRIGTAGDFKKQNCHPFYIGGDRRTVIGHNGVLPRKAQPHRTDYRSDTRLFAELYLPKGRFGHVRTKRGRRHVERWMGNGNKMVVLTVDPRYGKHSFILNERRGEWSNGVWYSNDSYKYVFPSYPTGWGWASSDWDALAGKAIAKQSDFTPDNGFTFDRPDHGFTFGKPSSDDDCMFCGAKHALGAITGICGYCETCNECGDLRHDCLCWVPRKNGEHELDTDDPTASITWHGGDHHE